MSLRRRSVRALQWAGLLVVLALAPPAASWLKLPAASWLTLPAISWIALPAAPASGLPAASASGQPAVSWIGSFTLGDTPGLRSALAAEPTPTGATAAGALGGSFRFKRSLDVAAVGWTRVVLTPVLWGLMTPDGHDVRVFGPDGSEVPYWRTTGATATLAAATPTAVVPEGEGGAEAAVVVDVSEASDGWLVTVDLGEHRGPHNRLQFEFTNHQVAAAIGVEASDDRIAWRGLASANLFRLGEGGVQQTSVTYPTSTTRFLRLHWPKSAGFPEVQFVSASLVPGGVAESTPQSQADTTTLVLPVDALPGGAAVSNYRLSLPGQGAHLKAITFGWGGVGTVAYRLSKPGDGQWIAVAEGTTSISAAAALTGTQAAQRAQLGLATAIGESTLWLAPEMTAGAAVLRLELSAGGTMTAKLAYALAEVEPEWLRFFAPVAGRYALAYGAAGLATEHYPDSPAMAWSDAVPVALGPEETQPLPPLPANVIAPGSELPAKLFKATWPIEIRPAAGITIAVEKGATVDNDVALEPGSWVRLDLPDELYRVTRSDLGDVRLLAAGHQLPYLLRSDPEPIQVLDLTVQPTKMQAPQNARGASDLPLKQSTIAIDLPSTLLPLTALELSTPASPFSRPIHFRYERGPNDPPIPHDPLGERDAYPGMPNADVTYEAGSQLWVCSGTAALPCRLNVPLAANPTTRLVIEFDDGDNAPLLGVRVQVWRQNDALEFAWPGPPEAMVQLAAGAADLGPPRYDLQALGESLRQRPALPVYTRRAAPAAALSPSLAIPSGLERWLLVGTLVLAAAVLLLLLSKTMRGKEKDEVGKE